MDNKAISKISYGMYVVTAREGDKDNGCINNTIVQAASNPTRLSICIEKISYTHDMIKRTGEYTASIISEDANFGLYKLFGFESGKDVNKFEHFDKCARAKNGLYYITEGTNAYISVKVIDTIDLGSHSMFIGEITDMEVLNDALSATYEYYTNCIKPKPQNVGTSPDGQTIWRCTICGHEYVGEELSDDYICPVCGHPKEYFEKIIISKAPKGNSEKQKSEEKFMSKFVCSVCGYVYEGDSAPEQCPVCHVPAEKFVEQKGEMKLAAEHVYGVYGTTVKNNPNVSEEDKKYILEQLKANFTGECSEVGMYLCMSRIAAREGYPEIALYWEKAAFEEAEHAAKFAELLGEELEPNMKATTKDNLKWRVDCEFGATQGKFDLAMCAKKNNLDAIHDTVHEMARDEARHGNALKGMLERFFK